MLDVFRRRRRAEAGQQIGISRPTLRENAQEFLIRGDINLEKLTASRQAAAMKERLAVHERSNAVQRLDDIIARDFGASRVV